MNLFEAYLGADYQDKATIFCHDQAICVYALFMTKGVQRADDPDYPALIIAEWLVNDLKVQISI